MERETESFKSSLLDAFELWKAGKSSILTANKLDNDLITASRNGVELILKVPKDVLEKDGPMIRQDAMSYVSEINDDIAIFNVRSDKNGESSNSKERLRLGIVEYRDEQYLILSSLPGGIIAMLKGNEVTSLDVK